MSGLAVAALTTGVEGVATLRAVLHRSVQLLAPDSAFMIWNSALAVVPLLFAMPLSVAPRRTAGWWCGAGAFVLFLPNAPYVLTDGIHFLDQVRGGVSNLGVFGVLVPVYLAFFALGLGSYVVCVRIARRYVNDVWGRRAAVATVFALHAVSAIGMYLGRILRLNSWDALTAPHAVVANLARLAHRMPALGVLAAFVVLITCTTLIEAGVVGLRARWREHRAVL